MISLMNDTQSVEGQPRLDVLHVFGVRGDESGQAPGRDDRRLAELALVTGLGAAGDYSLSSVGD